MRFVSCEGCRRHVRVEESRCPFCAAEVVAPVAAPPRPIGRLGRAALFAFGATVAASAAGCDDPVDPPAPAYGTPPADAGPEVSDDAGQEDSGAPVALYGGAPGGG